MGRKGYQGESPKDRATNLMDKFITRAKKKNAKKNALPARRKDPNVPIDMWPLKDQIEFWDNQTEEQKFDRKYTYSNWYDELLKRSGMYHITFTDFIAKDRSYVKGLFEAKLTPRDALKDLRIRGTLPQNG